MKFKRRSSTAAVGLGVLALVLIPAGTGSADQAADGKGVFLAAKCDMCHSVPTQEITAKAASEKLRGPDIVNVARDPKELASFLRKQTQLDGKTHQKEFKGTDAELQTLVDWVLQQKK